MKQAPRRSSWRGTRLFFLVGCSCLWVLVVSFTARDYLALTDAEGYSQQSFKSSSLSNSASSKEFRQDCNITHNTHGTTKDEIRSLFDRWNDALLTGDPRVVANLYYDEKMAKKDKTKTKDSQHLLLLPTLSNEPRTSLESVEDYFVGFLKRKPRGRIVSGQILMGPDGSWAHDAGIYEFVLQNEPLDKSKGDSAPDSNDEKPTPTAPSSNTFIARGRYSFFYLRDERGEWKIAHHHSSLMPESD